MQQLFSNSDSSMLAKLHKQPLELSMILLLFLVIATKVNHQDVLIPLSVMFIPHFSAIEETCSTSGEKLHDLTVTWVKTKLHT